MKRLYEMYLPALDNSGNRFSAETHDEWCDHVTPLTGGHTTFTISFGEWIDPETGKCIEEPVYPVRIYTLPDIMEDVAKFTKVHYQQKTVMYYEVTDKVFMV